MNSMQWRGNVFVATVLTAATSCGDNQPDPFSCAQYQRPVRAARKVCASPDAAHPSTLQPCEVGSADVGTWTVDAQGLPAFDFLVDQRCDQSATAYSPRPTALRDPVHLIGDGFGTEAMAHASGGIDVYTQDRGHTFPVHIDTWVDPKDPGYPAQLGGALGYLVVDGNVRSTRFEDLPVTTATTQQTRRFGVGYVETVTTFDDVRVTRRTFAVPGTRALVTEVTVENLTNSAKKIDVAELYDINIAELPVEYFTSDLLTSNLTSDIARRRRAITDSMQHVAHAQGNVTWIESAFSQPKVPWTGVGGTTVPNSVDEFPDTMFLATLDATTEVQSAWLADDELWKDDSRKLPPRVDRKFRNSRQRDLPGHHQPGVLGQRVELQLSANGQATTSFVFGTTPHGSDGVSATNAVRAQIASANSEAVATAWRKRLTWGAFPGLPDAAALQRELAWSSYMLQAMTVFDQPRGLRYIGQGGSYKFVHGIDGAIGDYALFAEAALLIDPALAADTLAFALSTQHGATSPTPGRFPYATTGTGNFTDMLLYNLRSDAYFLLPSVIGRYLSITGDGKFLQRPVSFWTPTNTAEHSVAATVFSHLETSQQFANDPKGLGIGARGLLAMGTNDYADGVLQTATEPATPLGSSSTFNVGLMALGFRDAAGALEKYASTGPESTRTAALAASYRATFQTQTERLRTNAWSGQYFWRGFVDSGNPLAAGNIYLEPQVLPIIAGLVDDATAQKLLRIVEENFETPLGPMTVVAAPADNPSAGPKLQSGAVWPVSSPWLTEAYARYDVQKAWSSLIRNTLFTHAELFPSLWYGVWSGPDSYYAQNAERPGEADAHLATALTDYPVFNTHSHSSLLRALPTLLMTASPQERVIRPRIPSEDFAIEWPTISIRYSAKRVEVTFVAGKLDAGASDLVITLPSQLRTLGATLRVSVNGVAVVVVRQGDTVRLVRAVLPSNAANATTIVVE
jgi:hypothetical protein